MAYILLYHACAAFAIWPAGQTTYWCCHDRWVSIKLPSLESKTVREITLLHFRRLSLLVSGHILCHYFVIMSSAFLSRESRVADHHCRQITLYLLNQEHISRRRQRSSIQLPYTGMPLKYKFERATVPMLGKCTSIRDLYNAINMHNYSSAHSTVQLQRAILIHGKGLLQENWERCMLTCEALLAFWMTLCQVPSPRSWWSSPLKTNLTVSYWPLCEFFLVGL